MKILEFFENVKIGSLSLATLLAAALVFFICLIVIRVIERIIAKITSKSKLEKGLKSFISSVITVVLWAIAVVMIAGTLGIPTASLVALLSVAGLALSLSIQGIISNLFSGATILATKPFISGDFVEFGGVSGTVEEIGLFHTQLLTVDNRRIFVPNSDVTAAKIINYSNQPLRRVDLTFSAAYDCPTESVKNALFAAARAIPAVLDEPGAEVYLSAYKDSNIEYVMRAWVKSADYWPTYYELNEKVREKFDEYGVYPSYPQVKVIN